MQLFKRLFPSAAKVYADWEHLVSLFRLARPAYSLTTNVILLVIYTLTVVRIGFAALAGWQPAFAFGSSLARSGNTAPFIIALCCSAYSPAPVFRLIIMLLQPRDRFALMQAITEGTGRQERQAKIRLMRAVYLLLTAACLMAVVSCEGLMMSMACINVWQSESFMEALAWICWSAQDLAIVGIMSADLVFFPGTWILLALDYRMDLLLLIQEINAAAKAPAHASVQQMSDALERLLMKADILNAWSGILFFLTLATTATACLDVYIVSHSDNVFFRVLLPFAGVAVVCTASFLMALAGNITAASERLHTSLSSLACRSRHATSVREKRLLLLMLEETGCAEQRLALYTLTGNKYTPESFVAFLIETALHYTLLLSFSSFAASV